MKKISLIIIVILFTTTCKAQLNNLNDNELFETIKFNNITLNKIMQSKGDYNQIKKYFGNNMELVENKTTPFKSKEFSNNNINLSFEDETDIGNNFDLSAIIILNSNTIVNVKNLSIKIGDDKIKFEGYLYNYQDNSYNFTDKETGSIGLSFKINPNSKKVSEINLICY